MWITFRNSIFVFWRKQCSLKFIHEWVKCSVKRSWKSAAIVQELWCWTHRCSWCRRPGKESSADRCLVHRVNQAIREIPRFAISGLSDLFPYILWSTLYNVACERLEYHKLFAIWAPKMLSSPQISANCCCIFNFSFLYYYLTSIKIVHCYAKTHFLLIE